MLKAEFLEILVCPQCKGKLDYKVDPQDDKKGKLICQACQVAYLVEDDIPNLIPEEAVPLGSKESSDSTANK